MSASTARTRTFARSGSRERLVEPGAFRTGFAGSALRHMPVMEPYRDVVGGTRDFARSMNETQEGDPLKSAAVIDEALRAETTPLRLQLGADSVAAVRSHALALLADLAAWEARATDVRVDDTSAA